MKIIEKVIQTLEDCVQNDCYESIETESFELKNLPANSKDKEYSSIKESICAFLNTEGGIILVGIKEDIKNKKYIFKNGYQSDFEPSIKILETECVCDFSKNKMDISDYIKFKIHDFLDGTVLCIYVEKLPHDKKYVFFDGVAYERKLTGDHHIDQNKILANEEYKQEIQFAKELHPVLNATLANLSVDILNEYIYQLNKEIKIETNKASINEAIPFLTRKCFINKDAEPTVLGMLVCGEHVDDFLGNRCQVDCFVESSSTIVQNKKVFKGTILNLLENSFSFVYRNIKVGISAENGGTSVPEYPENLIRESINNSLAHRDYTINRFVSIDIVPQKHIEISNPGGFKKGLLIEETHHAIPLRRIIPNQKPVNPKLADILKVFNKYEGKGIGMATLVNACLQDKIDLPYYKFRSENEISLTIPRGKLLDENMENLFTMYSGFIENKTQGEKLTENEKYILSYLYKSEKANENYQYTILLTPDNNHFEAIKSLEKTNLIYKHELSTSIYPIYIISRELIKDNYTTELIALFGSSFKNLSKETKDCLHIIYQINTYSLISSVSASQIGNILYTLKYKGQFDIKLADNFKRKIRTLFNKLEEGMFIVKENKKYILNKNYGKDIFG